MKMTTTQIYIYNENCTQAGRQVPQRELDRYEDQAEAGDWTGYEATDENAAWWAERGQFGRKIARTIREYLA